MYPTSTSWIAFPLPANHRVPAKSANTTWANMESPAPASAARSLPPSVAPNV